LGRSNSCCPKRRCRTVRFPPVYHLHSKKRNHHPGIPLFLPFDQRRIAKGRRCITRRCWTYRTLGLKKLEEIEVPVPIFEKQLWFNLLQSKVDALLKLHTQTAAELDALLPAILDLAFKGEL
jgi:hypothetical protein